MTTPLGEDHVAMLLRLNAQGAPREAVLCMNDWGGYFEQPVIVVGETPKRYRIASLNGVRVKLGGRQRWLSREQTALVPKAAVRFTAWRPASPPSPTTPRCRAISSDAQGNEQRCKYDEAGHPTYHLSASGLQWPTTPAPRCTKVPHVEGWGYLHAADDDGLYNVDGAPYCGRCHRPDGACARSRPAAPGDEGDARCGAIQNHLTCTLPDGHAGDYHEDFDHGREWSVARPAAPQAWGCFACAFETDNDQMAWDHRKSPHRMYKLAAAPLGGEPTGWLTGDELTSLWQARQAVRRAEKSGIQADVVAALNAFWDLCDSDTSMQLLDLIFGARASAGAPPCTFCGDGICARCAAEPRGAPETAPLLDLVEEWHDDLRDILDDPSTLNPGLMAEGTRIAHGMMLGRIANAMRDALESLAARPAEVPGGETDAERALDWLLSSLYSWEVEKRLEAMEDELQRVYPNGVLLTREVKIAAILAAATEVKDA